MPKYVVGMDVEVETDDISTLEDMITHRLRSSYFDKPITVNNIRIIKDDRE